MTLRMRALSDGKGRSWLRAGLEIVGRHPHHILTLEMLGRLAGAQPSWCSGLSVAAAASRPMRRPERGQHEVPDTASGPEVGVRGPCHDCRQPVLVGMLGRLLGRVPRPHLREVLRQAPHDLLCAAASRAIDVSQGRAVTKNGAQHRMGRLVRRPRLHGHRAAGVGDMARHQLTEGGWTS